MNGYEKRLRDIEKALDDMVENPKDYTVGDYSALASERSTILLKIEAEANLSSKSQYVREKREAMAKVINEKQ